MVHFSRSASIIGAPLVLAALMGFVTPAGARSTANTGAKNGTSVSGLGSEAAAQARVRDSARIAPSAALTDLNGVAVEAVILPDAAIH